MKLLIVDDEPLEREVLLDIVKKSNLGFIECLEAKNGLLAVDIASTTLIDVMLIDIKMPKMDGLTAAKLIKKMNPEIKIIFLTAFNEFDYALQTIKIGVEDYLLKPVRPEELVGSLTKVVESTDIQEIETPSTEVIEQLITYIKGHLEDKLTLNELSQLVHLHPQYLSRLFKQKMDRSLTEYITSTRLEKSKELLVDSQYTITEISRLCGFSDSNYFTRVFRKQEGIPPSHYRKNEQLLKKERVKKTYIHSII
ncbi:response regulator transcription factor [Sporosarcina newyorkensis]|uniref:response regulator transcription factor n=1 Tax=Sporosarcina newyorkensis TaxID=759851 RepID=UPI00338EE1BE